MNDEKIPSPVETQLLALVVSEMSGREVAKEYKKETGRTISYGTLYTTFRRLKDRGWVSVRDAEDEDGRVRYFRIEAAGSRALARARLYYERIAGFRLGPLRFRLGRLSPVRIGVDREAH